MFDFTFSTMIWLALCALFVILEATTVNLVSVWFAIGALAALVTSSLTDSALIQLFVFAAVSFLTLIFTRPLLKHLIKKPKVATNSDLNIGKTAKVIVAISPDQPGRVRLEGVDWAARAVEPIPEGELCTVCAVESATLVVQPQVVPVKG